MQTTLSILYDRLFSAFQHVRELGVILLTLTIVSSCSTPQSGVPKYAVKNGLVVSVVDQRMAVIQDGKPVKTYPVSTSKFGHGDSKGSNHTPLGALKVTDKIGGNQPAGMVFKSRKPTGEILQPDAPGRDPIVSRILWLSGTEKQNRNAKARCIYIHGTPEERNIGRQASYGCIRMKSNDIIELYDSIGHGTEVVIENCSLKRSLELIDYVYSPYRNEAYSNQQFAGNGKKRKNES